MFIVYYAPGTCALASHITLEQSGASYRAVRLDFGRAEQRGADYLAINPKGRVPSLATERGVLTETPAILAFIAQSAPQARLAPLDDPFAFARAHAFNSYLCSTVHVAHAHRMRGPRWSDDPTVIEGLKLKVSQNMPDCFTLIEQEMFEGPWVLGEAYSICDAYLFTLAGWLEGDGVDPGQFPKVADMSRRMNQDVAVRKVLAEHQA
jgi:glutathione S-transferase